MHRTTSPSPPSPSNTQPSAIPPPTIPGIPSPPLTLATASVLPRPVVIGANTFPTPLPGTATSGSRIHTEHRMPEHRAQSALVAIPMRSESNS